ncbi:MAG: peptidoglycan DD-metalloendopeptidase family protein [Sulfurovum sp.]|nr:peptidoglycan DD-metalloendopeptidase family protein [Sulfurovum sp.]
MKSFILWTFLAVNIVFGASTSTKIANSKNDLSKTDAAQKDANRKLEKIAIDMNKADKEISYLDNVLEKLTQDQKKSEDKYAALKVELSNSEETLKKTTKDIEQKKSSFLELLSEQFSVIYTMQQFKSPTEKSIMSYEVYKAYKKQNAQELEALKKEIFSLKKEQKQKQYKYDLTKNAIAVIVKKRKEFIAQKEQKRKLIATLSDDEEKYQNQLQGIVDKQASLRTTLSKLNILQKQEVEESRKRATAKREAIRLEKERLRKIRNAKRLAKEKVRNARAAIKLAKTSKAKKEARKAAIKAEKESKIVQTKKYKPSQKVRKVHSSYKKSQVYAYKGGKTISPLNGARVIKKFGTYMDPIYKIKIFNESITLQSSSSNARVKNVLNGKVVFAGKSSMLGKVVVVAHGGKMHTVYAGLSKISPTIHVGSKIKKGYVVGKVTKKLIFQATKNSKHINPLKLIQI